MNEEKTKIREKKQRFLIFLPVGFLVITLIAFFIFFKINSYREKVLPNTFVADIALGELPFSQAEEVLKSRSDKFDNEDVIIRFVGFEEPVVISNIINASDNFVSLATFDYRQNLSEISAHQNLPFFNLLQELLKSHLQKPKTFAPIIIYEESFVRRSVEDTVETFFVEPVSSQLKILSFSPFSTEITPSKLGRRAPVEDITRSMIEAWKRLQKPEFDFEMIVLYPVAREADLLPIRERARVLSEMKPIVLSYIDEKGEDSTWKLTADRLSSWLSAKTMSDGVAVFVDREKFSAYLDLSVRDFVERPAKNAMFNLLSPGRAEAFQSAENGVAIDVTSTLASLESVLTALFRMESATTTTIPIVTTIVYPEVTESAAADLGLREVLGRGVSIFKGSPANRVKNIKNGAKKLHGVLIGPGEEFSTIIHTEPYTLDSGYLPELVIKGNKLTPEIGGGLCQIGTTLFRMAMNSGMKITERRNHSLVVSYYNDLANGNPGTDATIYDPAPDFKFLNDTENFVLIQVEVDEVSGELIFSLWGTPDGRQGSYSPPIVRRWIPYGSERITETDDLPPGKRNCQNPFRGAETTFTYKRTLANGEVEEQVFDSYYRPLPAICLVGRANSTSTPQ